MATGIDNKLGQAVALSAGDWDNWTQYVLDHHSCRMYVVIMLTGMFGLRCGESCMLTAEDLQLTHVPPQLRIPKEDGRGKTPGSIPIMPDQVQIIQQWMEQGISQKRSRTTNQHGKRVEYMDYYKLPTSGRLFLPREQYGGRTTNKDHLSYHAVWSAVNKLEKAYTKERGTGLTASMSWERIRTHSGRATKITLMMGEGISLAVSMRYARHSSDSIHTHLRYGRLSCAHIYNYLLAERERVAATAAETPAVKRSRNTAVAAELCGTTLKDLVCWAKEGILTAEEFEKAKKNLACLQ